MAAPVTTDIRGSLRALFATRRDRSVVLGLVALAAVVSTSELLATQLFALLILPGGERSDTETAVLVVLFFVVFAGLRVVNYVRELYRINVFERALTDSVGLTPAKDSWRWATAMEVTSLLSMFGRVAVVVLASLVLAPVFGLAVLVATLAIGKVFSVLFTRQLVVQREFRAMQLARNPASNADRVRARIRAGEIGSLIAYLGIVVLIGVLVLLTLQGSIEPGTAFVLFIALRMMGQMLTGIASSLMRYVRARAFSE